MCVCVYVCMHNIQINAAMCFYCATCILSPGLYQNLRGAIRPWGGSPGYGHLTLPANWKVDQWQHRFVENEDSTGRDKKNTYKPAMDETMSRSPYIS